MGITPKAARVNANDMKRSEAAEKLNITADKLYHIEAGHTVPDINLAKKMSELYGIPLDDLIFFKS